MPENHLIWPLQLHLPLAAGSRADSLVREELVHAMLPAIDILENHQQGVLPRQCLHAITLVANY